MGCPHGMEQFLDEIQLFMGMENLGCLIQWFVIYNFRTLLPKSILLQLVEHSQFCRTGICLWKPWGLQIKEATNVQIRTGASFVAWALGPIVPKRQPVPPDAASFGPHRHHKSCAPTGGPYDHSEWREAQLGFLIPSVGDDWLCDIVWQCFMHEGVGVFPTAVCQWFLRGKLRSPTARGASDGWSWRCDEAWGLRSRRTEADWHLYIIYGMEDMIYKT